MIYQKTDSFTNVDSFDIFTKFEANLFFDEELPRTWSLTRLTSECHSTREVYDSGGVLSPPKGWYRLEVYDAKGQLVDVVQPVGHGSIHVLVRDHDDDSVATRLDSRDTTGFVSLWNHATRSWTCTSAAHVSAVVDYRLIRRVLPCAGIVPTGIIVYEPRLSYFTQTAPGVILSVARCVS